MNLDDLASQYFAMWNETDPNSRERIIDKLWGDDATYVDPMFAVHGHEGLSEMVEAAHDMFPGHAFRLSGSVDAHHDRARWTWELAAEGQPPVAGGIDVVRVAEDGRLAEVVGFIDFAPST